MTDKELNEKIEGLKKRLEEARIVYIKCEGALEVLESMKKENKE